MNPLVWILIGIAALIVFVIVIILFNYFALWFQGFLSKTKVSLMSIVAMRFRKVNSAVIVINQIRLVKAGITGITTDHLENHYLAGGNVGNVVSAIIAASNARIDLD